MAFIYIYIFFFEKVEKFEKIGYHSRFLVGNCECNTERVFKNQLYIELGIFAAPHIALLCQKNLIKVKEMWNDAMKRAMRGWLIASYCFLHALPITKVIIEKSRGGRFLLNRN